MSKRLFSLLVVVLLMVCNAWSNDEFVDLGLSVEWATCNLGANTPQEKGDYYAWGETATKKMFKWSTYIHCKGSIRNLTKYCTKTNFGTVDSLTHLTTDDDAAHVQNKGYRTPTKEEYDELLKNCTWEWSDNYNGSAGYIVTSKKEGYTDKSIFFPISGRTLNEGNTESQYGYYWTSDLNPYDPGAAYVLFWDKELLIRSECSRFYGAPIRAVKEKIAVKEDSTNTQDTIEATIEKKVETEVETEIEKSETEKKSRRKGKNKTEE